MTVANVKKQRLLQVLHLIVYQKTLQSVEDKSVQNQPNASETSAESEKRFFQKIWLRYYKWLKGP